MKRLMAVLLVLVLALSLLGCQRSNSATGGQVAQDIPKAGDTFTIGLSAAFSGVSAVRGKYMKDAAELAVKQINDAGGVNGLKFVMKYEDHEGNPNKTVSTVAKLIDKEGVKAIVVSDSTGAVAAEPLVAKAKIPMMVTAFSPSLTETGSKNIFRSTVSDAITGVQVVDFAVKELGFKKVAVMGSDGDYGQGGAIAGTQELIKLGYPAVTIEKFKETDQDFSSQLLNIKKLGADVLFLQGLEVSSAVIVKQAREMGLMIPVVGATALASEQFRDLAGVKNVEGIYTIVAFMNSNTDPVVKKWVADFLTAYKYKPDANAARADAAVRLIIEAVKVANSTDPEKVTNAIHSFKNVKLPGGIYSYDEKGEGLKKNVLGVWKNGVLEFVRQM